MSKTKLWTLLVLVVGIFALVAAGCGDDDEGTTDGGETTETSEGEIASVDDLAGKVVGAQDGTTGETFALEETDAEVRGFPEGPDAINAVINGQVDAVIIDLPVAIDAIDKQGGLEVVEEIETGELYGFAMATDNDGLQAAVNGALAEIKEDGALEELYQEYFETEPTEGVLGLNDLADPVAEDAGEPVLLEDGTLTVGTDTPFPPFEIGQPPDITGFDIEVMNIVAERIGLEPTYVDTGFDTIFRDVGLGQFDIVAAASTITPGRERAVDFSDPYYEANQALVVASE